MGKVRPREVEQLITQLVGGSWDLNPGRLAFALGCALLWDWCHARHFTEQETKVWAGIRIQFWLPPSSHYFLLTSCPDRGEIKIFCAIFYHIVKKKNVCIKMQVSGRISYLSIKSRCRMRRWWGKGWEQKDSVSSVAEMLVKVSCALGTQCRKRLSEVILCHCTVWYACVSLVFGEAGSLGSCLCLSCSWFTRWNAHSGKCVHSDPQGNAGAVFLF